jgi:hypothetical protein
METQARYVEKDWNYVVSLMPGNLESLCSTMLALSRKREVVSAQDYLRICMAYSVCDMSLRQTAAWATATGVARLSDVAVLKRLRAAPEWLGSVLAEWFYQHGLTEHAPGLKVRILDATVVSKPGSHGTDWRLHLRMDLSERRIEQVELTDEHQGERLERHTINKNEVILGDRAYATNSGIAHVLQSGGHVVVRSKWNNLALKTQTGDRLDILSLLETMTNDEIGDWPVLLEHEKHDYPLRLVAIRKSDQAAEKTRRELKKEARKKGRSLKSETLKAASYIFVITDLPKEDITCIQVLELYRMRWQIELLFKRLKSILGFKRLRAKDDKLCQTYLLAKILGALVIDELTNQALSFFPWGFRLPKTSAQPLAFVCNMR